MQEGTPRACQLAASSASGMRGDIISLTASGGDTYDWTPTAMATGIWSA